MYPTCAQHLWRRAVRAGRAEPRHILLLGRPGRPHPQRKLHRAYLLHVCVRARQCVLTRLSCFQHGAIRTTLSSPADYDNDDGAGFHRIEAREIDTLGVAGIIKKIRNTVGSHPVYMSIDVRTLAQPPPPPRSH